jgi:hypothetical protein
MKKIILIAMVTTLSSCGTSDEKVPSEVKNPSSKVERTVLSLVEQKLGSGTVRIIQEAEKAEIVPVSISGTDTKGKEQIGDFFITGEGRELTIDELSMWKSLLLDEKTYIFDRQKRCAFLPDMAILFQSGKIELPVIFSSSCRQAQFIRKEASVLIDIDPIADEIENLAETINLSEEEINE